MNASLDVGRVLAEFAATSALEWAATVLGVTYVLLVMRRRRLGWIAGGASAAILMLLAVQARLPMQGLLQFSYVLIAVYGWRTWRNDAVQLPVSLWHWRHHLVLVATCVAIALVLAPLLRGASDWPLLDPLVAGLGLSASWLTARMKLENWIYWVVIDAASFCMFAVQGHPAIALLFLVYLTLSVAGFISWRRVWRLQPA